ncbi:hypothetical protein D5S18_21445 [Nocardia panacis]|uniref:Metallo-beta-lactamase domain-containing protein n=1 Tax=Nocardia panacis TaxID=2340916 RepID=A0A3A4K5F4_9NOCA|nr:hypothetical protein [Nocardia panacis]RJO73731.1 hypothetical protein D5S18_21445 [Nocardia panacis]
MNYRITLLSMGIGEVPGPEVRWMRDFDRWRTLQFQVALIRSGDRTALVNTGPPEDLTELNRGWAGFLGERAALRRADGEFLLDQLRRVGVDPTEVTDVILTPLQLYTVGNVMAFPAATIHLARRGWVHFHTSHDHPHDDRRTSIPQPLLNYLTGPAWPRLHLLEDEDTVAPGLRTWWCGGHHRASLVVEVDTEAGVAALSDSYFHLDNVVDNHPIGITENIYESLQTYARVRRDAKIIVPLYDPQNFVRFPNGEPA